MSPRHVLVNPATKSDMILAFSRESHIIGTKMFRIFRWKKDFEFGKDSTKVATWIRMPHLPFIFFNLLYLQRLGDHIGEFIRGPLKRIEMDDAWNF